MSFARDALYGLYGALRLARGDASGVAYFDDTGDGALRSFRALFLVLPGFAIYLGLIYGEQLPRDLALVRMMSVELLGQVVGIVLYLLALQRILESQGQADRFARYVTAYNWAMVVQVALLLSVTLVLIGGWLPEAIDLFLQNMLSLVLLIYPWFVARSVLQVSSLAALGYLALDVAVTILVNSITGNISGMPTAA